MKTNSLKSLEIAGYIVRSAQNPKLVLAATGEWLWESLIGPGMRAPKVYKTERGALRSREGGVTAHAINAAGLEVEWLRAQLGAAS